MKRSFLVFLTINFMLFLCGCGSKAPSAAPAMMMVESVYEAADYDIPLSDFTVDEVSFGNQNSSIGKESSPADAKLRKIIYTAYLQLTADNPGSALEIIMEKTLALGGYVAASYTRNDDFGVNYSNATLKVPAPLLDELVNAAETTGITNSYSLSSDDISLSYYDVQARLSNAKAEESQLLTILEECDTIEDLLAVREQLMRTRSDIESFQAQINLWDNLVDYATLELSIQRTERTAVENEGSLVQIWRASDVWKKITLGFQNSARFAVNAVGALGIFLAYALIPCAVLFCCIGLPIILHRRKKRRQTALGYNLDSTTQP